MIANLLITVSTHCKPSISLSNNFYYGLQELTWVTIPYVWFLLQDGIGLKIYNQQMEYSKYVISNHSNKTSNLFITE